MNSWLAKITLCVVSRAQCKANAYERNLSHIEYSISVFMNILPQFESLLPFAIAWAKAQETHILQSGESLSEDDKQFARRIGVREIERVRLLRVDAIPFPQDEVLGKVAREIGFISPHTLGMALRFGIFVRDDIWRDDVWRDHGIIAHELVHTAQYERLGFDEFLRAYLTQCLTVGYANSPLELEAIEVSTRAIRAINEPRA